MATLKSLAFSLSVVFAVVSAAVSEAVVLAVVVSDEVDAAELVHADKLMAVRAAARRRETVFIDFFIIKSSFLN